MPGKLVGILTHRDVRFAIDPNQRVAELMTKENLCTVPGVSMGRARKLLHERRIEKLVVVDEDYRCVGLITVKDIEKAQKFPNACKDERGRLRVAAATSTGEDGIRRAMALIEAEVDVVVVDTAHGHSKGVLDTIAAIKKASNYTQVLGGNIATADGAKALIDAGRRCGQGRDRAGLDLHHAHRRGRRRAPAHRHHGCGGSLRQSGHAGGGRRRHQISPAISPRRLPPVPMS
jgi:IMP dehydrogenase